MSLCIDCKGSCKIPVIDPMDNSVFFQLCQTCDGNGYVVDDKDCPPCKLCGGTRLVRGDVQYWHDCPSCTAPNGRLIDAATDVMRAQRRKGIEKYKSTLEDQNGYTVGGMIDMVAEELAGGSVYVQKVREQYLALLSELEEAAHEPVKSYQQRLVEIITIIKRERGNV